MALVIHFLKILAVTGFYSSQIDESCSPEIWNTQTKIPEKNKPSPNKRQSCKILIAAVNTCHFNVKPPVCYKSVHSFRVTYLFASQYHTKGYNLQYCTTNVLASLLLYT